MGERSEIVLRANEKKNPPPDSPAHLEAKGKIKESPKALWTKIYYAKQARAQASIQNSAPLGQDDGAAPNRNASLEDRPASAPKPSPQMMQHINYSSLMHFPLRLFLARPKYNRG
jgi:hypothetical protein